MYSLLTMEGNPASAQYQLLHKLYAGISHRENFQEFVLHLAHSFHAATVVFSVIDAFSRQPKWLSASGLSAEFKRAYQDTVACNYDAMINELEACEFGMPIFRIGSQPPGYVFAQAVGDPAVAQAASLLLKTPTNMPCQLILLRSQEAGNFNELDIGMMNSLVPYIVMALDIHEQQQKPLLVSIEQIRSFLPISLKEAQVCQFLLKGMALKSIAAERGVSLNTVREQVRQIYQKTGFKRQHELVTAIWSEFR